MADLVWADGGWLVGSVWVDADGQYVRVVDEAAGIECQYSEGGVLVCGQDNEAMRAAYRTVIGG